MAMAEDNDGTGFDASLKRSWDAWLHALGEAPGATADNGFDWREGLTRWAQLVATDAPAQAQQLGAHLQQQASGWLGAMQQLAARFAGRDTSAAEIAAAWRDSVEGQGDAMLHWMLDAARGGLAGPSWWEHPLFQGLREGMEGGDWLKVPAFGPAREHQARWQALLRAQREHRQHMDAYAGVLRGVLDDAFVRFEAKLAEHEAPGRQLTGARALFDLWIDAAEDAYAAVALSDRFQRLYAELANSQLRLQAAARQELERACEQLGMPTRTEMDAAHRRIADLERWVRRMANASAAPPVATAGMPADAPTATRRRRAAPKAGGSAAKKTATKKATAAPRRGGKA
ncbi:class III poly(R)-hydroxyalkanoic acid synthase subunit PhaE [Stenotrophomonas sp. CPCC 101365]|uniref:Poly(3-hydroxyalkanoate) polymerase subunit PhaE n=2 Tax=Stenotrophomonas mori TaxID=2871096 RepID=A0ABT0SES1_9GAMM|nr:class III poly(R)-hydroxyalkanoic acid synthase subunit PhaE [Stenotrophomonas mori]